MAGGDHLAYPGKGRLLHVAGGRKCWRLKPFGKAPHFQIFQRTPLLFGHEVKWFPAFRTQRASIRRKAFSKSVRTQLFEVRACFPEGGSPLFAGGLANDFKKEKEIKEMMEPSHQATGNEAFWHEGAKTRNKIWSEEKHSPPHPVHFSSVQFSTI